MSKKRMTMGDFLTPTSREKQQQQRPVAPTALNPPQQAKISNQVPTKPYRIRATKKGGVPCVVESRKHHKVVSLSNIEGDVGALLSELQKALGTGGVRKGNSIEVQGEHHLEKIRFFCLKSGCVVGATKQSKAEAEAVAKQKQKKKLVNENTTTDAATIVINSTNSLSQKEIKAMKPVTLKKHLAARDLPIQGNKKELVARLLEASTAG